MLRRSAKLANNINVHGNELTNVFEVWGCRALHHFKALPLHNWSVDFWVQYHRKARIKKAEYMVSALWLKLRELQIKWQICGSHSLSRKQMGEMMLAWMCEWQAIIWSFQSWIRNDSLYSRKRNQEAWKMGSMQWLQELIGKGISSIEIYSAHLRVQYAQRLCRKPSEAANQSL